MVGETACMQAAGGGVDKKTIKAEWLEARGGVAQSPYTMATGFAVHVGSFLNQVFALKAIFAHRRFH